MPHPTPRLGEFLPLVVSGVVGKNSSSVLIGGIGFLFASLPLPAEFAGPTLNVVRRVRLTVLWVQIRRRLGSWGRGRWTRCRRGPMR
jgi:hypothetical protein